MSDYLSPIPKADNELIRGRVSLIVPCYNVEKYFDDFLRSVLAQTYTDLEVILVNDGANEATTKLLRDSVAPLRERGFEVKLIEQENKGLGGAVDTGLKYFTGEYLMWPDPDDWLTDHSIERRVELMNAHPEVGLLRSNAKLFIEAKQEFEGYFFANDHAPMYVPEIFENFIFQRFFFGPVCHFVRGEMFLDTHKDRTIWYSKASSQNFQLLVPFVESFPVLQVSESLAVYRIREDSRSRAPTKAHVTLMGRHEQLLELSEHTLPKLKTFTPKRLERLRNHHWRNKMLPTAIRGKLKEKAYALIDQSSIRTWRKVLARWCVAVRCNSVLDGIDSKTGRIMSRLLSRSLDMVVRMPNREIYWGAVSLWSDTSQEALFSRSKTPYAVGRER